MADDKAAEATPETVENNVAEVVKVDPEAKEEQTPETPVTEPLTNGSSTPESPKADALASDEPAPAPAVPDQLPINGLSLQEPVKEVPEVAPTDENKPEESTPAAKETTAVPEIPVKTEVCDAKMPLIEPTPPPLPANPPPSSVASFAATTMAPELIEASLSNTTENAIFTPPAIPVTTADKPAEIETELSKTNTNTDLAMSQLSPPLKETISEDEIAPTLAEPETFKPVPEISETESEKVELISISEELKHELVDETLQKEIISKTEVDIATSEITVEKEVTDTTNTADVSETTVEVNTNDISIPVVSYNEIVNEAIAEKKQDSIEMPSEKNSETPEPTSDIPDSLDELPPPPPLEEMDNFQTEDKVIEFPCETIENAININHNVINEVETNGIIDETEHNQITNMKKDALGNIMDIVECNGNAAAEESAGVEPAPADAAAPPAGPRPQDPVPIADKIADLMPEIPTVPELKTETETTSEVAVAD